MFAPAFCIVGAPKSGTTALYSYLRSHPALFLPEIKEPHYFSADLPGLRVVQTADAYEALYRSAGERLCGDASASYLYSRDALRLIIACNPAVRTIAILRDPIEAAQALHQELLYNLSEDMHDFEAAWRVQSKRAAGECIPSTCTEPKMLLYRDVYAYEAQLTRLVELVSPEQRLLLLFDDLRSDPARVYREVLAFLCVAADRRAEFGVVNSAKGLRSRRIARWHRSAPARLGRLYQPAKRAANAVGIYPSHALARWNVRARRRPLLSSAFRRELELAFGSDVRFVERLLGRPLDGWQAATAEAE